ncbi:MAG: thrombospondin type 3 repeat-containing protein [Thermomicrobiales bacterium]
MLTARRFSTFVLLLVLVLPLIGEPASWSFASAQDEVRLPTSTWTASRIRSTTATSCRTATNWTPMPTELAACDPTPWGEPDTDGDGIPDNSDPTPNGDSDGDGIDELVDNCVSIPNSDQLDSDADLIGDACDPTPFGDPDTDGDGIPDSQDSTPNGDADGDGIGDLISPTPFGDPTETASSNRRPD